MTDTIAQRAPEQTVYENRKLYSIKLDDLHPDPNQPRKFFDDEDLKDLGSSIKKHGVLQPILFRKDENGQLTIVSGERRFQASKLVKEKTIPAIYTEGKHSEIALIENLLRVDLTPLEEAEGLKKLKEEAKYTNVQLATVIGKAESSLSEILSLNKLPEKIKKEVRESRLFSRRQLIAIAKIDDEKEQRKKFNLIKKLNTSGGNQKDKKEDKRSQASTTLFRMISGLSSQLAKIDLTSLSEEELAQAKTDLQKLVEEISKKL